MKEEKAWRRSVALVYLERFGNKKPTRRQLVEMEDLISNLWLKQPLFFNQRLTEREKEFLYHSMAGKTIKEISLLMKIEIDGAKFFIRSILKKLSCKNIKQAIRVAIRHGEIALQN